MAVGSTQAPDVRRSPIPQDRTSFVQIVRDGIEPAGMPKFGELDDAKLDDIRYYIRAQAAQLRGQRAAAPNQSAPSLIIK